MLTTPTAVVSTSLLERVVQICFATVVGPARGILACPNMTPENEAHRLIEIDQDGTVRDPIPPELRAKFADHERFSAVYYGGCIVLQGVR